MSDPLRTTVLSLVLSLLVISPTTVIGAGVGVGSSGDTRTLDQKKFKDKDSVQAFMTEVLEYLSEGQLNKAYSTVEKRWIFPASALRNLQNKTRSQLSMLKRRIGEPIGYEFVDNTMLGDSISRYVYFVKHEKSPVVWEFYFYKADSRWMLAGLNYHDKVRMLFQ